MSLNPTDQGKFDSLKIEMIDTVNPIDIMPSLIGVFTQQDIQMLTQKTEKFGNRFGMMDLLYTYENKARNLEPLTNALKQANYTIEGIFQDETASAAQIEKTPNVEAESSTVSELKERIKLMEGEMKGMQMELGQMKSAKDGEKAQREIKQLSKELKNTEEKLERQQTQENTNREEVMARQSTSEDKPSSSINYETTSTTKIGGLQFPSKSILLVGGMNDHTFPDMEVYCTEDDSKSLDLRINSRIRRSSHVGCKIGPKIIISSGFNGGSLKSTEFFDIKTGQWSDGPDMNEGRYNAMSATILDTFFVFGGYLSSLNRNPISAEKLQISSSAAKWQSIKDLPHYFYSGSAVAVKEQIYIIGQTQSSTAPMSSLIYVPAYDKYLTTIPPMKEEKSYFASAILNDNTIVVTGGNNWYGSTLNSCQMFDIRTKKWEALSDMNIARWHHQLVNVDEKLYAIGGAKGRDNSECLSSVEMCDIRNNKWINVHPIKQPRRMFTAFIIPQTVFGGSSQSKPDSQVNLAGTQSAKELADELFSKLKRLQRERSTESQFEVKNLVLEDAETNEQFTDFKVALINSFNHNSVICYVEDASSGKRSLRETIANYWAYDRFPEFDLVIFSDISAVNGSSVRELAFNSIKEQQPKLFEHLRPYLTDERLFFITGDPKSLEEKEAKTPFVHVLLVVYNFGQKNAERCHAIKKLLSANRKPLLPLSLLIIADKSDCEMIKSVKYHLPVLYLKYRSQ